MDWNRKVLKLDVALLPIALLLAVVLNWSAFVVDSLAIDEHVSFWIADRSSPSNLLNRSFNYSATPPLSFILQRLCLDLLGPREWAFRIPAAGGFLSAVVAVWFVGRRWLPPFAGGVAAILLAVHPVVQHFAVAGRPYSIGILLGVLAMLCTDYLRTTPRCRTSWLAWSFVNLCLIQTHYIFVPLWLAELAWLVGPGSAPRLTHRQFTACCLVLLALVLTVAPGLVRVWEHRVFLNWTTRTPALSDLSELLLPLRWSWFRRPTWWGVLALPILWQIVAGRYHPREWIDGELWLRARAFLPRAVLWFCVPAGGLWLLGRFWLQSVAADRYLVIYTPPAALIVAALICTLRGKFAPVVATVALVLLQGFLPRLIRSQEKSDLPSAEWQLAARMITEKGAAGHLVLVASGLVEMTLVPAYMDDPIFQDYASCRLGRMYLKPRHTRLSLPMLPTSWTPEVRAFYRRAIASACQGKYLPRGMRSPSVHVIWLVAAIDTDLLRDSAAEAEALVQAAGAIELERIEGQKLIFVVYLCPDSDRKDHLNRGQ